MAHRKLYIAAYDISEPRRLQQALKVLKGYASGRQKSVFECFLTEAERLALLAQIEKVMDTEEDRFLLVRLDPRSKIQTFGIAVPPLYPGYMYIG